VTQDHVHESDHGHEHDHGHDHDHGHAHDRPRGAIRRIVGTFFGSHSHDPEDLTDRALETSARGIRALKISLLGLGTTAAFQLVIVVISGSVALFADTIHNFADALTAVPLWIAFSLGRRPADRRYTYGYGRAEDLAGIVIVAMIALTAALVAWESVQRLVDPRPVAHLGWVIAAGAIGFLGNEAVALYRIRVGSEIGSAALIADGHHARADGLTSLAVVLGGLGVAAGFALADPLVGLLITLAIVFVLRDAGRRILHRLMDAVEPSLTEAAERAVAATPGVEGAPQVRIRWVGHQLWSDVLVTVNSERSVADAHAVAEEVRHRLLHDVPRLTQVSVHVDPCEHTGIDHHAATSHHFVRDRRSA
jgi:cation diffusion facilitator family transporter